MLTTMIQTCEQGTVEREMSSPWAPSRDLGEPTAPWEIFPICYLLDIYENSRTLKHPAALA